MENNTIKRAFRHGFTLIELMIVIVILGILMGTILPRITGAQSKAQDIGAIADVGLLGQALEAYYGDYGEYPLNVGGKIGTAICLTDTDATSIKLTAYIKGGKIPHPTKDATSKIFNETATPGPGCGKNYAYVKLVDGYLVGTILNDTPKMNFRLTGTGSCALTLGEATTVKQTSACFVPNDGDAYAIGS